MDTYNEINQKFIVEMEKATPFSRPVEQGMGWFSKGTVDYQGWVGKFEIWECAVSGTQSREITISKENHTLKVYMDDASGKEDRESAFDIEVVTPNNLAGNVAC